MAGSDDIDLRGCTGCADIRELSAHINNLTQRVDSLARHIDKLSEAQKTDYDNIRVRIHEVVAQMSAAISQSDAHNHSDIDELEKKIEVLYDRYNNMAQDISIVTHTLQENAVQRKHYNNQIIDGLSRLDNSLVKHMHDEEQEIEKNLKPIRTALERLESRWWSIAVSGLGLLGSGFLYLFLKQLGWIT